MSAVGVILAAGSSSRMGVLKPRLPIGRTTLLGHVLSAALESRLEHVVVVLGRDAEGCLSDVRSIADGRVTFVVNEEYQTGQSSSLRAALCVVEPTATYMMVLLADEFGVDPATIDRVLDRRLASNADVVRAVHGRGRKRVPGHPVAFHRRMFGELARLRGDQGARELLAQAATEVEEVYSNRDVPHDVDTTSDYDRVLIGAGP